MISGNFSPSSSEDSQELSIPFYCAAFEQQLMEKYGIGECVSRPASPVMSLYDSFPSSFAAESYPSGMEDPNYFVGLAEVDRLLPPIPFDMPSPPAAAQALPATRYEPYPAPSAPQQPEKRKRGRPMKLKPAGESKMATYSRQYREMKKNQLNQAENVTAELKQENNDLRSQMEELRSYNRQLEQEVEHLRQMMYERAFPTADVPVAAHY